MEQETCDCCEAVYNNRLRKCPVCGRDNFNKIEKEEKEKELVHK